MHILLFDTVVKLDYNYVYQSAFVAVDCCRVL